MAHNDRGRRQLLIDEMYEEIIIVSHTKRVCFCNFRGQVLQETWGTCSLLYWTERSGKSHGSHLTRSGD